jgi:hypothetical protein
VAEDASAAPRASVPEVADVPVPGASRCQRPSRRAQPRTNCESLALREDFKTTTASIARLVPLGRRRRLSVNESYSML